MQVKLVSYSQPTEEFRNQNINDALDLVAYCARVAIPVINLIQKHPKNLLNI